jgi:hypothetical protein
MNFSTNQKPKYLAGLWKVGEPWLIAMIAMAIVLFRRPGQFLHPTLWAEDATVFLVGASSGWMSLLEPYAGYLTLLPHLGALLEHPAGLKLAPAFYVIVSLSVLALVIFKLYDQRVQLPHKWAFALSLALVPHSGEVFGNLASSQWTSSLLLVLLVIQNPVRNRVDLKLDIMIAVLVGLTGPYCIFLTPLYIFRFWWLGGKKEEWIVAGVLACVSAMQIAFIHVAPCGIKAHGDFDPQYAQQLIGSRMFLHAFLGQSSDVCSWQFQFVAWSLIVVVSAWSIWKSSYRWQGMLVMMSMFLFLGSCIVRIMGDTNVLICFFAGDRYFYIPRVLTAWGLLIGYTATHVTRCFCHSLLCMMVIASFNIGFVMNEPDLKWHSQVDEYRLGRIPNIKIFPTGWTVAP